MTRYEARRHSTYGSFPWAIYDTDSGQPIEAARVGPNGEFRGYVSFYRRKKDAEAAIETLERHHE